MSGEKTEKASEQRKRKARDKGDTVRSKELTAAAAMLCGVAMTGALVPPFVAGWKSALIETLAAARAESAERLSQRLLSLSLPVLWTVLPVAIAALVAALGVGLLQGGGLQFRAGALAVQAGRLSPVSNLQQMVSLRALGRIGKSILPAAAIAANGWWSVHRLLTLYGHLSLVPLTVLFRSAYALALQSAMVLLAWAGLDYALEHASWVRRLRMTKQEVRDEVRDAAQNPQIRGKMRQIQRSRAKAQSKFNINEASVVITNPTHFAVALAFDFETISAPRVIGKGQDLLALRIRDEARWAGIPVVENPPLARSLYRAVEVGEAIPFELYAAVAGILAYLYRHQVEQLRRHKVVTP